MHLAGYPPRVKTLCRKLGVDFAEALVGFERRGGATFPNFDGVVVCSEHEDAVREGFAAEERCALPSARSAAPAWALLPRAVALRARLHCFDACAAGARARAGDMGAPRAPRREKEERAEAKWRAAAEADWRKLLSTVLARLRVEAAHEAGTPAARAAGAAEDAAPPAPGGGPDADRGARGDGDERGAVVKVEEI